MQKAVCLYWPMRFPLCNTPHHYVIEQNAHETMARASRLPRHSDTAPSTLADATPQTQLVFPTSLMENMRVPKLRSISSPGLQTCTNAKYPYSLVADDSAGRLKIYCQKPRAQRNQQDILSSQKIYLRRPTQSRHQ